MSGRMPPAATSSASGMIGCGGRNTGAADQALTADKGARLVAMCDILMDRVKAVRGTPQEGKGRPGRGG